MTANGSSRDPWLPRRGHRWQCTIPCTAGKGITYRLQKEVEIEMIENEKEFHELKHTMATISYKKT